MKFDYWSHKKMKVGTVLYFACSYSCNIIVELIINKRKEPISK